MNGADLKAILFELDIKKAGLAQLLGVNSRSVRLWIADKNPIPGPVVAYMRLLKTLPLNLRQIELNRLKERDATVRQGIYGVTSEGQHSSGMSVLIFDAGRVYGTDTDGVRYDGDYSFEKVSRLVEVKLNVTVPRNVRSVLGVANPYEWALDITTKLNPEQDSGSLIVRTSIGQNIGAQYKFLRTLPEVVRATTQIANYGSRRRKDILSPVIAGTGTAGNET